MLLNLQNETLGKFHIYTVLQKNHGMSRQQMEKYSKLSEPTIGYVPGT